MLATSYTGTGPSGKLGRHWSDQVDESNPMTTKLYIYRNGSSVGLGHISVLTATIENRIGWA